MPSLPQYDDILYSVPSSMTATGHLRVKLNGSGQVELAGDELAIGSLTERGATADEEATVRSAKAPTSIMIANGAIAVGDTVYSAAGGKVSAVPGAVTIGMAYIDAAANNHQVLVLMTA